MIQNNKKKLLKAGILNAKNEINWFLQKKFNITKEQIYFNDYTLDKEQKILFNNFIERTITNEPFQYIINKAPFLGVDLYVDSGVLIPRPETEIIINIYQYNSKKLYNRIF